jgi:thiol peroxidase
VGLHVNLMCLGDAIDMAVERTGLITVGGRDATVIGNDVKVGDLAQDFSVHTTEWLVMRGLADTQGKVRILAAVSSLDTEVCDRETRRFNQEAASLSQDIVIEVISTDLPFTQKRWCGAAGVERVITLSDHMSAEFGAMYGVLIKERRILRRAIFVIGRDDRLKYVAYMPELGVEPDYAEVLEAARKALAE